MSPTDIVRETRTLIQNKLLPAVPTKWWPQLSFGLEAFALQPFQSAGRNGRAIPAMVETTYALHIPGLGSKRSTPRLDKLRIDMLFAREQQSFTGHTIDALQTLADRLGFWPKLVFDRGFGNESIVEHLHAERATFYIRFKGGNYVSCDGVNAASNPRSTVSQTEPGERCMRHILASGIASIVMSAGS